MCELGVIAHNEGLPDVQAETVRRMMDWFSTTYGPENVPSESAVKQRVSRFYHRLRGEFGYRGGLSVVGDAVRAWRQRHAEVLVPIERNSRATADGIQGLSGAMQQGGAPGSQGQGSAPQQIGPQGNPFTGQIEKAVKQAAASVKAGGPMDKNMGPIPPLVLKIAKG